MTEDGSGKGKYKERAEPISKHMAARLRPDRVTILLYFAVVLRGTYYTVRGAPHYTVRGGPITPYGPLITT